MRVAWQEFLKRVGLVLWIVRKRTWQMPPQVLSRTREQCLLLLGEKAGMRADFLQKPTHGAVKKDEISVQEARPHLNPLPPGEDLHADPLLGSSESAPRECRHRFCHGRGNRFSFSWCEADVRQKAGSRADCLNTNFAGRFKRGQSNVPRSTISPFRQSPRSPHKVDGRVHGQFHDGRGDHAADHGRGDAFHDIGAGTVAP